MLLEARREAAQDLENLKLIKPEHSPEVAALKYELRQALARDHKSIASEARLISKQAKQSSARHRNELVEMKKTARDAAANLSSVRKRSRP